MNPALKHLATIELGVLSSKIVSDDVGRRCIAVKIGEREVCFTITQALLMREMLDLALRSMASITFVPPDPEADERQSEEP